MIYEITSKSDFQTGMTLVAKIPEDAIDKKAFYTLLSSLPDFLMPFRHRFIDGQVEFTYEIGKNTKLVYRAGNLPVTEYAALWSGVLSPMLDCDDWFLNPFSFVLHCEYLYLDKDGKQVKYLYIPSIRQISDENTLKEMVDVLTETITVADVNLENKVLRAIRKDFNPKDFLQMLKPYQTASISSAAQPVSNHAGHIDRAAHQNPPVMPQVIQSNAPLQAEPMQRKEAAVFAGSPQPSAPNPSSAPSVSSGANAPPNAMHVRQDDIVINIPTGANASKDSRKEEKEAKKLAKKEERDLKKEAKQEEREQKKNRDDAKSPKVKNNTESGIEKEKRGFFGSKKKQEPAGSLIMGAAAEAQPQAVQQPYVQQQGGNFQQPPIQPAQAAPYPETDSATELDDCGLSGFCGLKLISHLDLPQNIAVSIEAGKTFSIGRFDAVIGTKQSDFEFDKNTKAVSRRHAVIERKAEGYYIVDIGLSAGTFVNNEKLIRNAPHPIKNGDKISIGNAGADYVWTEA